MPAATEPEIVTLGCRLNIAESETIRALVNGRDLIVVNSCAVTNEAVKATRAAIRRARRARPAAELVVTGCAAQIDPAGFARMAEVDRVIGNGEKLSPAAWRAPDAVVVGDIMRVRETAPHLAASFAGHARAFVEVQNGCDHRCTFCAIPFGRGPSQSVPAAIVVARIAALAAAGHREVVLTGVDLTSYAAADAADLGALVERILTDVPALTRLRLSSLDSIEIDDRLFALVTQEPRIMPHLHLSFQSGSDLILKRMRRRHSRRQAIDTVARLKAARAEIAIGADLIAGFPTEDAAMAADTLALIAAADIVHAHIFPYSPRDHTPAARMPQVEPALRRARAATLRAAAAERKAAWLRDLVGTVQAVLIERRGDAGHAANFAEVRLSAAGASTGSARTRTITSPVRPEPVERYVPGAARAPAPGTIARVRITAATDSELQGMSL
ncbi:tRNA (N(6)-L-threonylcarbamoyladenosine(37)-C(2))-methylthiotransferase MtaB [Sphingomonas sp. CROZ-RG-20F-R02-07]|uniref:tRNA (N(6)-L-threonylcarbamoyladenosine(37)-C(2))- methylthiotransferase MtaB n=1 Tax=Sphingomonas sp. CROZ-RG-20F-R02-07 TaxID=2914832 RepID=UPI001F5759CF|nr:tRNA (N(6)-L-threonylcarbamoyladenosine(37)-C(2))-methylthiotransferase MtaB [Sphingomonas sp. CROZ-RG-20F-R02-07]